MANLARFTAPMWDLDTFHVFDDFFADQSDLFWVDTVTDLGTALVGDAANGIMTLTPSDGTVADNDEVYLASANEVFIFAASRPLYGRCRLKFTETAAGVYNAAFGFANAVAADLLVDNGGGLRTTGCVACIYKVDGGQVWRCQTRNSTTTTDTASTTSSTSTGFQTLEVVCQDFDAVNMQVTFRVDGVQLKDSNLRPIVHFVPIASATEMQVFAGAKLGAITNNDVLLLDYIYAHQLR